LSPDQGVGETLWYCSIRMGILYQYLMEDEYGALVECSIMR